MRQVRDEVCALHRLDNEEIGNRLDVHSVQRLDPMDNSTTKMGVAQCLEWGGLLPNLLRSVEVKSCRSLLSNGSLRTEPPAMADKSARTFDRLK